MELELSIDYPSATEEQIRAFEEFLGVNLPSDYRAFLSTHNGGHPINCEFDIPSGGGSVINLLYGIGVGKVFQHLDRVAKTAPRKELILIGRDVGGSELYLGIKKKFIGQVLYMDREEAIGKGKLEVLAESFESFMGRRTPRNQFFVGIQQAQANKEVRLTAVARVTYPRQASQLFCGVRAWSKHAFSAVT